MEDKKKRIIEKINNITDKDLLKYIIDIVEFLISQYDHG